MALQDSTVILSVSSARHLVRDYVFGGSGSLIRQGHLGKSREGWHGNLEAMRPWGSPGQGLRTFHDATTCHASQTNECALIDDKTPFMAIVICIAQR
ncbi:hypothetical protein T06_5366 [Trichinella sp. T6]|nr:hypothetical protein T06_5366 [Trichinella sp. T6]